MTMNNITYNQNILFPAIIPIQPPLTQLSFGVYELNSMYAQQLQLMPHPNFYHHITTAYQQHAANVKVERNDFYGGISTSSAENQHSSSSCMFQTGSPSDMKYTPAHHQTSNQGTGLPADSRMPPSVGCDQLQTSPLRHQLRLPTIKTSANVAKNVMSEECDLGYYSFTDLSPLPDIKDTLSCDSVPESVFDDDVKSTFSDMIDDVLDSIDTTCFDTVNDIVEGERDELSDKPSSESQQIHQAFALNPITNFNPYFFQNTSSSMQTPLHPLTAFIPSPSQPCFTVSNILVEDESSNQGLVCSVCNKSFQNKANLKVHQRMHKGERPHTCQYCNKTFTQKSTLRTHIRIHTGEKPFGCSFCERAFSDYSTYRKHVRIHTGEKPYTCDVCKKSFTQSGNMIRHREGHYKKDRHAMHIGED